MAGFGSFSKLWQFLGGEVYYSMEMKFFTVSVDVIMQLFSTISIPESKIRFFPTGLIYNHAHS